MFTFIQTIGSTFLKSLKKYSVNRSITLYNSRESISGHCCFPGLHYFNMSTPISQFLMFIWQLSGTVLKGSDLHVYSRQNIVRKVSLVRTENREPTSIPLWITTRPYPLTQAPLSWPHSTTCPLTDFEQTMSLQPQADSTLRLHCFSGGPHKTL